MLWVSIKNSEWLVWYKQYTLGDKASDIIKHCSSGKFLNQKKWRIRMEKQHWWEWKTEVSLYMKELHKLPIQGDAMNLLQHKLELSSNMNVSWRH